MNLSPLAGPRETLSDQVYDAIVTAVLNRQIDLGDALIMDQLAESLGTSRTPVRDALKRLEVEGLIEPRGRRGYVVSSIGQDEVTHLYQAREAIEGYAAGVVASTNDEAVFSRIERAIHQAQDELDGTVIASYRSNRSVHRSIVDSVGNRYLTANFDNIWGVSIAAVAYGRLYSPNVTDADLWAEHECLVTALRSGNPELARLEMVRHINDGLASNLVDVPAAT